MSDRSLLMDTRRALIARILIRNPGISQRQIAAVIAEPGKDGQPEPGGVNDQTGEPWSVYTINADVKVLRQHARDEIRQSAVELLEQQILTLRHVQQQAFAAGDLRTVIECMREHRILLGYGKGEKINVHLGGESAAFEPEDPTAAMQDYEKRFPPATR